jgi:DNA (cytosine-5)-methyltransferase 1
MSTEGLSWDELDGMPAELLRFLVDDDGRPTLLDLFAGEGGAGEGYHRAGFRVFAVDTDRARLRHNPFPSWQGDALDFVYRFGHLFHAIHASPPCTGYTRGTAALPDRLTRYERLIPVVRVLLQATGKPYVIENVEDARSELDHPLMLCWTHFRRPGTVWDDDGTPLWMRRHRLFESNLFLTPANECDHRPDMQCAGAYGGARRDKVEARTIRRGGYVPSHQVMRRLLDTGWMSEKGCQLSIPPTYTHHLGDQLREAIEQ